MTQMLTVTALEECHPMLLLILDEPGDLALQAGSSRPQVAVERVRMSSSLSHERATGT